ncbi:DnaT-like ssDNA-binding protein [Photorhabdus luminescens]|uniref:DnaT-like ssDNA-binding protein n=1 Tax=Photorhabdus luminescens TaxID=29488 RepID=UPI00224021B7|nr:DnaT-like ssDNA-binding protein [Photorhabdus luminescens]MCW7764307.1 hypothetical protein [Photorhabdus luminescens subsp. venezuelensis]
MIDSSLSSPGFNSYAGIGDLRNYADSRGIEIPDDDKSLEQMLTSAMDYLNNQKWKGQRTKIEQQLPFPRKGLIVDGDEISSDEIPKQLIQAQCRLAIETLDNELSPTIGGEVLSESVSGVVSITYASGTNSGSPKFPWIKGLLSGLLSASCGAQFDVYRG